MKSTKFFNNNNSNSNSSSSNKVKDKLIDKKKYALI